MATKKREKIDDEVPSCSHQYVYVLYIDRWNHHNIRQIWWREYEIVAGVYATKEAAAAAAGDIDTDKYGTFNEALGHNSGLYYEEAVDNRDNPPDNGELIQIGGFSGDRDDFVRLSIRKMPILGALSSPCNKKQK